ncbi:MAG: polyketide synthase [Oscillochloris sp.]|nr:polyketide synthase [Oscillochloris sp.]
MHDDIAIVGMAGLFPGAPDLNVYWEHIIAGFDATGDPPPDAWDPAIFYDREHPAHDRVYCKRGGFLGDLARFDPLANGVMPNALAGSEPDQWLALQVARSAFHDAGYANEIPERQRTAVILGKGTYLNQGNLTAAQHGQVLDQTIGLLATLHPEYSADELARIRAALQAGLPPFNPDTAPGLIPNITVGRIANRFDLMGPAYTVDAACASSLIAVDMACRDLRAGRCDLALAGGIHVVTPVPVLMLFCQLGALSRREQIRPFDHGADGTLLSEGLGMAVLKRRSDAERAGDRIYALVKGIGVASDGRALSVLAPRVEGQELALRLAYEQAGIDPRSVGLIEAHGTATLVGDATEIQSLSRVFGARGDEPARTAIGSVKSMIGHTMPAAGMAGLIKAALALYERVLPPTINVERPSPELQLERTPFYLNTATRPWIHGDVTPRRAGVNAFGFGGINAHVILEANEAEAPTSLAQQWDSECVLVAGVDRADLIAQGQALLAQLDAPRRRS